MNRTEKSGNGEGRAALATPTDLSKNDVKAIADALNGLAADAFALYLKTKNFHWHMSGPHFRDYHLLLDEHSDQIFAMIDPLAERVRKLGQTTLRSIGNVAKLQSSRTTTQAFVAPLDMLSELDQTTTRPSPPRSARRTSFATTTATSPRRASSKSGSTRRSGEPGSCSRRAAAPTPPATEATLSPTRAK